MAVAASCPDCPGPPRVRLLGAGMYSCRCAGGASQVQRPLCCAPTPPPPSPTLPVRHHPCSPHPPPHPTPPHPSPPPPPHPTPTPHPTPPHPTHTTTPHHPTTPPTPTPPHPPSLPRSLRRTPLIMHLGCVAHQYAKWHAPPAKWGCAPPAVSEEGASSLGTGARQYGTSEGAGKPACCWWLSKLRLARPRRSPPRLRHPTPHGLLRPPPPPSPVPPLPLAGASASQVPFQRYRIAAAAGASVFVDPTLFALALRFPLKECLHESVR